MQNILKQKTNNKDEKSEFVFNLAVRRVLNSILREEFKHTQPGNEPDEDFLKLKFDITSSYAMNENGNDSGFIDQNKSSSLTADLETESF